MEDAQIKTPVEDAPLFPVCEEVPCENPKNYSLARKCILVDYKTLAAQYSPKAVLQKGSLIVDVVKKKAGTCVSKGHVKGKQGAFCTIKQNRRNHHAAVNNCLAMPNLNTFVHSDVEKLWFKFVEAHPDGAKLRACYGPLPQALETAATKEVEALFASSDEDDAGKSKAKAKDKDGTLLRSRTTFTCVHIRGYIYVFLTRRLRNFYTVYVLLFRFDLYSCGCSQGC